MSSYDEYITHKITKGEVEDLAMLSKFSERYILAKKELPENIEYEELAAFLQVTGTLPCDTPPRFDLRSSSYVCGAHIEDSQVVIRFRIQLSIREKLQRLDIPTPYYLHDPDMQRRLFLPRHNLYSIKNAEVYTLLHRREYL